jgi:hypothetical protein
MADDSQSVASSITSTRGVRDHIKKQLATDIEANGGIQFFAGNDNKRLYHLLQERVDDVDNPYGPRAGPLRTKLRRLVNTWKGLDNEGRYVSQILNPWQIVQFSALNKPLPQRFLSPTRPQRHRSQSNISQSSSDSGSSVAAPAAATPNRRTTSFSRLQQAQPRAPRPSYQTPPRNVFVDSTNTNHPVTPLTPTPLTPLDPLIIQFLNMNLNENNNNAHDSNGAKRKVGDDATDWKAIANEAGKCSANCLIIDQSIYQLT